VLVLILPKPLGAESDGRLDEYAGGGPLVVVGDLNEV